MWNRSYTALWVYIMKLKVLPSFARLTFAGSFVVNEFFESRFITIMVKVFAHVLAFLRHGVSVFTRFNVFW